MKNAQQSYLEFLGTSTVRFGDLVTEFNKSAIGSFITEKGWYQQRKHAKRPFHLS